MNTKIAVLGPNRFAAYVNNARIGEGTLDEVAQFFADAVIEQCAKTCEQRARTAQKDWFPHTVEVTVNECATRIRALKGTP